MTDTEILDLFRARSETAIEETAKQYGPYCSAISMNILRNREDAEECVNDTYWNAWNAIPPRCPAVFSTFLGRITRNLSLDRYKARNVQKRGGSETELILSELDGCIPSGRNVEDEAEADFLAELIDRFLSELETEKRRFFVRRYWYADTVSDIAEHFAASQSSVKTSLFRTRNKLKDYLEREGVTV